MPTCDKPVARLGLCRSHFNWATGCTDEPPDRGPAPITIHIGGETADRLRRISAIDGRSPEDLALCAVEEEARKDMRGDLLRSA